MDTTGLSSPPSLCAQFSGAVGTPSLVAAGQRLRGGVPDGGHGQRLVWVSFCGGEEVSRGVSDQGVRGGGKPRDVVLQALPCGLSPGAPASLRVGGFEGPLDGSRWRPAEPRFGWSADA